LEEKPASAGWIEFMSVGSHRIRPTESSSKAGGTDEVVRTHLLTVAHLVQDVREAEVTEFVRALEMAREQGRTVFTMGNGGSAATALHMANDLARATRPGSPPLRLVCLSANVSHLSGLANDYGYDQAFVRQLHDLVRLGDVLIGISASGNSANCVNALSYGRQQGAVTLSLLGFDGGRMKALSDHCVHVPCHDYLAVEDVHLVLAHALARALKTGT
jgi:D-sedoheptulose 7-phosphate isomerase